MGIIAGVQAGKAPYPIAGATGEAPIRLGVSAGLTGIVAGTPQQLTLPVDSNGNAYAAFIANVSAPVWACWNTGSGAATATGANCYLLTPSGAFLAVPPPGATGISVVGDTGGTAGSFGIAGLF